MIDKHFLSHIKLTPLRMKPSTPSSASRALKRQNCIKFKTSDLEDLDKMHDSKTPKYNKSKKMSMLDEMGFGMVLPIPKDQLGQVARVPSIGVSDFWSAQEKEKFLKATGCWGVYKEQKKKEEFEGITLRRIARHSSLPSVLDLKTEIKVKEKVLKSNKKVKRIPSKAVSSSETPESSNKQVNDLKILVKKCDVLAQDMTDFRNSARRLENILKERKVKKKKNRISRQDYNEIQNKIYSFN